MASSYSYGGVAYRVNATSISFALPYRAPAGTMVHLLLENMGRINFSHGMDTETKGVGEVTLNGALWKRWTSRCLAFDYASEIIHAPFAASSSTSAAALFQPTLFRGTFHADAIADTFVEMRGWSKGAVWINGFALGRYVEAPLSNDNDLASIASLQFPPSAASARASLQVLPCSFFEIVCAFQTVQLFKTTPKQSRQCIPPTKYTLAGTGRRRHPRRRSSSRGPSSSKAQTPSLCLSCITAPKMRRCTSLRSRCSCRGVQAQRPRR